MGELRTFRCLHARIKGMLRRQFNESVRSSLAMIPGALVAVAAFFIGRAITDDSVETVELMVIGGFIGWPFYTVLYLWWTHRLLTP